MNEFIEFDKSPHFNQVKCDYVLFIYIPFLFNELVVYDFSIKGDLISQPL